MTSPCTLLAWVDNMNSPSRVLVIVADLPFSLQRPRVAHLCFACTTTTIFGMPDGPNSSVMGPT